MGGQLPEEPMIVVKVRDLISDLSRDMNKRMDDIARKLDDRVTVGVFSALRSDLDSALRRLGLVEDELAARTARDEGVWWTIGKLAAILYALTMTALAIWGLTHGG